MKPILAFAISFCGAFSLAHASPTTEVLCKELVSKRKSGVAPQKLDWGVWDSARFLTQLFFQPKSLIDVKRTETSRSNPGYRLAPVLVLAPKISEDTLPLNNGALQDILRDQLRTLNNLDALKDIDSFEFCLKRVRDLRITDEDIDSFAKARSRLAKEFRRPNVHREINQYLLKTKLLPGDKIISFDVREDLFPIIERETLDAPVNLVFVGDANQDGLLLDPSGKFFPPDFFENLGRNPQILISSVTIFSCLPDKVAATYRTAFAFLSELGIPVFLPQNRGVLAKIPFTPVKLLPYFLEKLREE